VRRCSLFVTKEMPERNRRDLMPIKYAGPRAPLGRQILSMRIHRMHHIQSLSYKLKQKRVANPADMWIAHDNAFLRSSLRDFAKAQEIMRLRETALRSEALERLALWDARKVSDEGDYRRQPGLLSGETYRRARLSRSRLQAGWI